MELLCRSKIKNLLTMFSEYSMIDKMRIKIKLRVKNKSFVKTKFEKLRLFDKDYGKLE